LAGWQERRTKPYRLSQADGGLVTIDYGYRKRSRIS
jgi:hypothetical protein